LRQQRLVNVRVERAVGLDLVEALAREQVGERAVDERDALLEGRLLVGGGRPERPLNTLSSRPQGCITWAPCRP